MNNRLTAKTYKRKNFCCRGQSSFFRLLFSSSSRHLKTWPESSGTMEERTKERSLVKQAKFSVPGTFFLVPPDFLLLFLRFLPIIARLIPAFAIRSLEGTCTKSSEGTIGLVFTSKLLTCPIGQGYEQTDSGGLFSLETFTQCMLNVSRASS